MLSRFFIRLRNVTRSGAPRQDCHTSNHWCVLYHYHHYYYYYYNKNKWAVSEWVWFFDVFGFGGWGDSRGHFTQWGCWDEGRVLLGLPVLQNVRRWRSNRCVSPFVVFNNPLWVFESTTYWPFHAKIHDTEWIFHVVREMIKRCRFGSSRNLGENRRIRKFAWYWYCSSSFDCFDLRCFFSSIIPLEMLVRFVFDPVRCASHPNSLAVAITRGLVATFVWKKARS